MITSINDKILTAFSKNYTEKQKPSGINKCSKCTIIISGEFASERSKFTIGLCNMCDNSIRQFDDYGVLIGFIKPAAKQLA